MNNDLSKITAIMVLYNVTDLVLKCLDNLKNIKIIIADNGENDPLIIDKIKKNKNIVRYYKFKKNLGFGRAINFCFDRVETEYSLLIEPDVFINETDIVNLVKGFTKYPNAGILAPTLIDKDKNFVDELDNLPEQKQLENQKNNILNNFEDDTCIFFCWAAILLLNNKIIKKTGLFNKKIFIFWEDFYLCRKLKEASIPIIKIFNSKAIHLEGASTNKNIKSKFIIYKNHILSSYIYFNVNKNDTYLKKKFFLYLFRCITYLFIFNFENSLKNFARLCAVQTYLNQK
ncbi:glycosyltransferase family 2 protein [Candidatus Pelagibacter sp.]|nr:glycosyltransferase family 2 protein [Candidatus Pelagibacter sp.]